MRTRRMEPGDLDRVGELSEQLGYPVDPRPLRARFDRLSADASQALFVALDGADRVVGWINVQPRWLLEADPFAEIIALVVDARVRRQGIGRGLVTAAETWARTAGFERLRVRSNVTRAESHDFYLSLGFERLKTQHTYLRRL